MKKFYRILLLLATLVLLTTYIPNNINFFSNNKNSFFEIKNIEVYNNKLIFKNDILDSLKNIKGKNILFLKKSDIDLSLKSIDFLEKIEVKKQYPNKIIIKIYETIPVAILLKDNTKYLVDNKSNLVTYKENITDEKLPNIFGKDAEVNFINFFEQLQKGKFPKKKIKNYYFFKIGRWDLQLVNNQIIKFPSEKISDAISQSIELLENENFKNYSVIDLRIHGKIVVE